MTKKERSTFEELDLLETKDPMTMEELSHSSHKTTRLSVASSSATTKETLMNMARTETNTGVLQTILDNPRSTADIKAVIAARGYSSIALSLADSGNSEIEHALLLSSSNPLVLQQIAATTHDNTIAEMLWNRGNFLVKIELLKRFPNLLNKGLEDSNPIVRNFAKKKQ